jgi:hypothetical protein
VIGTYHKPGLCLFFYSQLVIKSVIDDIGALFDDNAKNVFGTKSSLSHDDSNVRRKQTPWFNSKCRTNRKAFHAARKTYNTYKTNVTVD